MATIIAEVYDAFRSASAEEREARNAAQALSESLAPHEDIQNLKGDLDKLGERIDKLDDRVASLAVVVKTQTWMLGLVVLVVVVPQLVTWFST